MVLAAQQHVPPVLAIVTKTQPMVAKCSLTPWPTAVPVAPNVNNIPVQGAFAHRSNVKKVRPIVMGIQPMVARPH